MSQPKEPTTEPTNDLLNLTSAEALDFLFPKEIVEGLKTTANPEKENLTQEIADDYDFPSITKG